MKEILVMGGIAAHRGYLITEALFAAKTRHSQDHLHIAHIRLGLRVAYTPAFRALRGLDTHLR